MVSPGDNLSTEVSTTSSLALSNTYALYFFVKKMLSPSAQVAICDISVVLYCDPDPVFNISNALVSNILFMYSATSEEDLMISDTSSSVAPSEYSSENAIYTINRNFSIYVKFLLCCCSKLLPVFENILFYRTYDNIYCR